MDYVFRTAQRVKVKNQDVQGYLLNILPGEKPESEDVAEIFAGVSFQPRVVLIPLSEVVPDE